MSKLFLAIICISLVACSETQSRISGEGDFCGGIAAIPCNEGLACQLDGDYPDAGGTCVVE